MSIRASLYNCSAELLTSSGDCITGDLKNLCELCAGKIVQDSNMTRYCISVIPVYLLGTLMKVRHFCCMMKCMLFESLLMIIFH